MGFKSHFYTHPSPQGYIYTTQQPVTRMRTHIHAHSSHQSPPLFASGHGYLLNSVSLTKSHECIKMTDKWRTEMQACYGCRLQKPSSYFTHQTCRQAPAPLAKPQLPEKVMGGKIATRNAIKAGWERCAFSQHRGDDYLKKYCEWTALRIFNALGKSIYGRVNKLYLTLYTLNDKRKSLKVSWVVKAPPHTLETSVSFNKTGSWVICETE